MQIRVIPFFSELSDQLVNAAIQLLKVLYDEYLFWGFELHILQQTKK